MGEDRDPEVSLAPAGDHVDLGSVGIALQREALPVGAEHSEAEIDTASGKGERPRVARQQVALAIPAWRPQVWGPVRAAGLEGWGWFLAAFAGLFTLFFTQ